MAEETVFVVDDDRTTVRLCQRLLERASYRVLTSRDPVEALQYIKQHRVDLLLSDIRMPVMDGFELVHEVKQARPDLPVLVMTGYGSIENAIQLLHRGVDGLILKPFSNTDDLIRSVQQVLEDFKKQNDAVRSLALRPLFDVTESLLAETSPERLEKRILSITHHLFRAAHAGFSLHEANSQCVMTDLSFNSKISACNNDQFERLVSLLKIRAEPVLVNVGGPGEQLEMINLLREMSLGSFMFVPVQRGHKFIFCATREVGQEFFSQADLEMFVIFARQAVVALENAWLYSELRDALQQVEESQQALIQAEKMAAVGQLVASLAHEINNPLQAVQNCLNLASRQDLGSDQYYRYLGMMDHELSRLTKTVWQMLDFYRPKSGGREDVEISLLVCRVLDLLEAQLGEQNIEVHYEHDRAQRLVSVFPGQIEQVILNLLLNAIDAIEGNYKLHHREGANKKVWIDLYISDRNVYVSIEDSGPGVPEGWDERKFEPFNSTKENGTGLGLAVSYTIMENHQGSIDLVKSRHGKGACFELALPLVMRNSDGESINC